MRQQQPFQLKFRPAYVLATLACACLTLGSLSGCNSFGNSRLVKELQSENDRLLSEFRAQRDRASELEKANQLQAARLAESEKLLARLSQGSGAGRLSSLPHSGLTSPGSYPAAGGSAGPAPASPPALAQPGELRWQPRLRGE